ncbi:hypothetical protein ACDZ94_20305 [Pseudomonas sp. UBT]|uniref:hypothetical protein n=1 Tax=Pseudomonas sp. UBT TaxID=3239198 RepID=UPI003D8048AB
MISGDDRDRLTRLIAEFHDESDRGCAVIAMCVLEEMLLKLIKARLPDCANDELRNLAPVGRLSAAVDNAFLIGVLGERNKKEFKQLIKIRNLFAHKPLEGLTFDNHDVVHLCSKLVMCDMFEEFDYEPSRGRYIISVVMLYLSMHHEVEEIAKLAILSDRGFEISD